MNRFYVRPEDVKGDNILVSKEEAHHIADVMRLGVGDDIVAFDGTGREYVGKIVDAPRGSVKIKIDKVNKVSSAKKVHFTLAQAIPKRVAMDFIVEKATELGVDEIIPVITQRTIVRLDDKKRPQKETHWQNIAISASRQCGRFNIAKVRPVIKFSEVLKEIKNYDLAIMACLSRGCLPINEVIKNFKGLAAGQAGKKILFMIGPEGDFSPQEIGAAKKAGAKLVSLGQLVLRVDTAALFVLSVLNYESKV